MIRPLIKIKYENNSSVHDEMFGISIIIFIESSISLKESLHEKVYHVFLL